jgi:hypothetical protein
MKKEDEEPERIRNDRAMEEVAQALEKRPIVISVETSN